jgi:hypothetical protein
MLKPEEYTNLATVVEAKGGSLRTSLQEYLNTHHIPNWYPFLREFTAETKVFDNDTLAKVDINHVFHLLKYSGVPVHDFHDFDQPDYGSVDYRVRTAIATEPVYPEDVEGIIDYLPLWTPEENFVKRAK